MKQIILMSIQPKWVAKILNGEKTVEIRKTALHEGDEVHIYCTKGKPYLYDYDGFHLTPTRSWSELHDNGDREWFSIDEVGELNGKVVAKFIVGKVERIDTHPLDNREQFPMSTVMSKWEKFNDILKKACLLADQLDEYSGYHKFKEKPVYALSITKLEIFDKPRELGEYKRLTESYDLGATGGFMKAVPITRAPQSWQYAWVEE